VIKSIRRAGIRSTRSGFFACAAICLIVPQEVPAQDDNERQSVVINTYGRAPHIRIAANSGPDNCTLEWYYDTSGIPATLILPFQRPGGTTVSRSLPEAENFIVSGWRVDGTGVLCKVSFNSSSNSITLLESREYPGVDPLKVAFTGSRLFIIDLAGKKILTALWSENSALPAPGQLQLATTLGSGTSQQTIFPLLDSAGLTKPNSCGIGNYTGRGPSLVLAPGAQGGWVVFNPDEQGEEPYDGPYHVTNALALNEDGPILLWGEIGNFNVENLESSTVVANGVITNSTALTSVLPAQSLIAGDPHRVLSSSSENVSSIFYPTIRYGKPMWLSTGGFLPGLMGDGQIVIGESDFVASIFFGYDTLTTSPQDIPLLFVYNWGGDPDPVIVVGETALLVGSIGSQDHTLSLGVDRLGDRIGGVIPIPFDPNLVGRRLLFQWATLAPDGVTLVLSDVYGSIIRDSTESSASSQSSQLPPNLSFEEVLQASSRQLDAPEHKRLRLAHKKLRERLLKER
jgi:hypothetical protein